MPDTTKYSFSVAMCLYDGDDPSFFREALQSVFEQSLPPNEVIVQVDGPINEKLESIIKEYTSKYKELKVFRLAKNMGHGIARNECLSHCSFEYVAIADADDINCSNRFERQIQHFKNNRDLSAVSSACYHFCESIENISNIEYLPLVDSDIKKYMKKRCPLCQASTMFKKTDVLNAGGYVDWYHAEDYYLWVRMFLNGAVFENDEQCLLYVRTTKEQSKRRGGIKYFKSIRKLFKYMLKHKIINLFEYIFNVTSRFFIQVIFPNKLRIFIRKLFQ